MTLAPIEISSTTVIGGVPTGLGLFRYSARAFGVTGTIDLDTQDRITAEPVSLSNRQGLVFRALDGRPIEFFLRDSASPPVVLPSMIPTWDRWFIAGHSYDTGNIITGSRDNAWTEIVPTLVGGFTRTEDLFDRGDSQSIVDLFNRSSGASLGSTEAPVLPWTAVVGTWGTDGTQAQLIGGPGGGTNNHAIVDTGMPDVMLEVTIGSAFASANAGIVLRQVDSSNYIRAEFVPGSVAVNIRLVKAGVASLLGTMSSVSFAPGARLAFVFIGTTLFCASASSGGTYTFKTRITGLTEAATFTGALSSGRHGLYSPTTGTVDRFADIKFTLPQVGQPTVGGAIPMRLRGGWTTSAAAIQCQVPEATKNNVMGWDFGFSDGAFEMEIGTAGQNCGLAFRIQDADNYWRVLIIPGAFGALYKVVGGTATQVGSNFLMPQGVGAIIRVDLLGPRIRVSSGLANANLISTTDPLFQTTTICGVFDETGNHGTFCQRIRGQRIINQASGGSQISNNQSGHAGTFVEILQNTPRLSPSDLAALLSGINDVTLTTTPRGLLGYKQTIRAVLARYLAKTVYESNDPTIALSSGWVPTAVTDKNSGGGYTASSIVGSTVTINVPASYAGEIIDLGVITVHDDLGGTADVTVDGIYVGSISTIGVWVNGFFTTDAFGAHVLRLLGPFAPGAHTIKITVTSVQPGGSFIFNYWATEQPVHLAPRLLMANVAHITDYSGYFISNAQGNANVTAMNEQLYALAAEFGGLVTMIDIDSLLAQNPANFAGDGVHPDNAGHAQIGSAFGTAAQLPIAA